MSTQQAPGTTTTRWRIDPARSSVEFAVKGCWGIVTVKGGFTTVDRRELGMTWNMLGTVAWKSTLTVRGRLVAF